MSVTTTANRTTQSILTLLADYELTHSGDEQNGVIEPPNERSKTEDTRQNPEGWRDDYDGVPPYRPINHDLDREQRPWARPGIETAFVWTMLNGVGVVASTSRVWRLTGGRINDKIFRFSIGGER